MTPAPVGSVAAGEATPGPWYVPMFHGRPEDVETQRGLGMTPVPALTNDGQRCLMARDSEGKSKRVALIDCQTHHKRGTGHQTDCAERDANALLLAAAPNLRDTLVTVDRMLRGEMIADAIVNVSDDPAKHYTLGEFVRAALAKARV